MHSANGNSYSQRIQRGGNLPPLDYRALLLFLTEALLVVDNIIRCASP